MRATPSRKTGRKVLNRIDAEFVFRAGKIARHTDSFDLWAWAGMALGLKGRLLGWLPPVQGAICAGADKELRASPRARPLKAAEIPVKHAAEPGTRRCENT